MTDDRRHLAYLLGTLDAAESDALEGAYLGDAELFLALQVAEAELIDAYAAGDLDDADARAFEGRLTVVPEWPRRLAFARAIGALRAAPAAAAAAQSVAGATSPPLLARLRAWLSPARGGGVPGWGYALALGAVLVVAGSLLLSRGGGGGGALEVTLRPDNLRSSGASPSALSVVEGADAVAVHLELELPDEFATYGLIVRRHGAPIYTSPPLAPDAAGVLTATIPADLLPPAVYELAVSGVAGTASTPVAFYTLVVQPGP